VCGPGNKNKKIRAAGQKKCLLSTRRWNIRCILILESPSCYIIIIIILYIYYRKHLQLRLADVFCITHTRAYKICRYTLIYVYIYLHASARAKTSINKTSLKYFLERHDGNGINVKFTIYLVNIIIIYSIAHRTGCHRTTRTIYKYNNIVVTHFSFQHIVRIR